MIAMLTPKMMCIIFLILLIQYNTPNYVLSWTTNRVGISSRHSHLSVCNHSIRNRPSSLFIKQHENDDIKEKYIKLAQEAYNKYYSKDKTSTTSDEEYLKLARDAWVDSSSGGDSDVPNVANKLESVEDSTFSKPFFATTKAKTDEEKATINGEKKDETGFGDVVVNGNINISEDAKTTVFDILTSVLNNNNEDKKEETKQSDSGNIVSDWIRILFGGSAKESLDIDEDTNSNDEDIPYGLRAQSFKASDVVEKVPKEPIIDKKEIVEDESALQKNVNPEKKPIEPSTRSQPVMILKRKTSNNDEDDNNNKKDAKRLVRVDNGRGYSLVNDPLSLASFFGKDVTKVEEADVISSVEDIDESLNDEIKDALHAAEIHQAVTEGMTAEEAEQVRKRRLSNGSSSSNAPPISLAIEDGQGTAEDAEAVRRQRLKSADEVARELKLMATKKEKPSTGGKNFPDEIPEKVSTKEENRKSTIPKVSQAEIPIEEDMQPPISLSSEMNDIVSKATSFLKGFGGETKTSAEETRADRQSSKASVAMNRMKDKGQKGNRVIQKSKEGNVKSNKSSVKDSYKALGDEISNALRAAEQGVYQIKEGMTAEEAEQARKARVSGSTVEEDGQNTSEDAEAVRNARLKSADKITKELKVVAAKGIDTADRSGTLDTPSIKGTISNKATSKGGKKSLDSAFSTSILTSKGNTKETTDKKSPTVSFGLNNSPLMKGQDKSNSATSSKMTEKVAVVTEKLNFPPPLNVVKDDLRKGFSMPSSKKATNDARSSEGTPKTIIPTKDQSSLKPLKGSTTFGGGGLPNSKFKGSTFDGLKAKKSIKTPLTGPMKESFSGQKAMNTILTSPPVATLDNTPTIEDEEDILLVSEKADSEVSVGDNQFSTIADREETIAPPTEASTPQAVSMSQAAPPPYVELESNEVLLTDSEYAWLLEEPTYFPFLHVGRRIRSSKYGTTHEGLLVLSKEGNGYYRATPCIAKRPWSIKELSAMVPTKVQILEKGLQYDEEDMMPPESYELDALSATLRQYYEVETSLSQKFDKKRTLQQKIRQQKLQDEKQNGGLVTEEDINDDPAMVQMLIKIYPDDGSGGPNDDDVLPEYGSTGLDIWGKQLGDGSHEWLVFEGNVDTDITLQDAHQMDDGTVHRLHGIQRMLNLPEAFTCGDTLDHIFQSLLEDLVFLSSCNVVHRDLQPKNILCDGMNQRLVITNFGNAVDLDREFLCVYYPKSHTLMHSSLLFFHVSSHTISSAPRLGLENDSLELYHPGSIANTLAADVFSVALVQIQLLFGISTIQQVQQQLKGVNYDLDLWLQKMIESRSCPSDALDYLRQRPGLWSLLKGMARPNPLRKKITSDSLRSLNEVLNKSSGKMDGYIHEGESYLQSILDPSSVDREVQPAEPSAEVGIDRKEDEGAAFDITRVPFTLQPRTKVSPSILAELSKSIEIPASVQTTDEYIRTVTSSSMTTNKKNEFIDITRIQFSPERTSLLTDTLPTIVQQHRSGSMAGSYYDVPRTPRRVASPSKSRTVNALPTTATSLEVIEIIAPAGKLGVVVDDEGYVIKVDEDSPILGRMLLGDMIISVDEYDAQRLVIDDLYRLLISRANAMRIIQVLREVVKQSHDINQAVSDSEDQVEDEQLDEVKKWLLSYLPRLSSSDTIRYINVLIEDGFDCLAMLDELIEEDISFMKKAHKRSMSRQLFDTVKPQQLPAKSSPPSSDKEEKLPQNKKVYSVDDMSVATRKGIEAAIKEEKLQRQLAAKEGNKKDTKKPLKNDIEDSRSKLKSIEAIPKKDKKTKKSFKKKKKKKNIKATIIEPMQSGITPEEAELIRRKRYQE